MNVMPNKQIMLILLERMLLAKLAVVHKKI